MSRPHMVAAPYTVSLMWVLPLPRETKVRRGMRKAIIIVLPPGGYPRSSRLLAIGRNCTASIICQVTTILLYLFLLLIVDVIAALCTPTPMTELTIRFACVARARGIGADR